MYIDPAQNIVAVNWRIKEMQGYFIIMCGDRVANTRRSTPIANVKYNEDHAEVTTHSGSTYLLYSSEMNSESIHNYEELHICVKKMPELTPEEKIDLEEIRERHNEACLKFHEMGGFF